MPEDNEFQDKQPEAMPSVPRGPNLPSNEGHVSKGHHGSNGEDPPGFLELVYGVLFEPKSAMARVAARPPLGMAALVVIILSIVGTIMFYIALKQVFNDGYSPYGQGWFFSAAAFLPVAATFALIFSFFKWFIYSAVMHLAADLLGGRGPARAVFAVAGLSGLPAVFLAPFQFGSVFFPHSTAFEILIILAALAVMTWTFVLVVIGIKAAHGLSTGRALLSALTPVLGLLLVALVTLLTLAGLIATLPAKILPGYF